MSHAATALAVTLFALALQWSDCDDHPPDLTPPPGWGVAEDADGDGSPNWKDCDDADGSVHPGAPEHCDNVDEDCDRRIDEDFDLDGDAWSTCAFVDHIIDCDDTNAAVHPDAVEACDGDDDDCDDHIDEHGGCE